MKGFLSIRNKEQEEEVKKRSIIHWQTGEPQESGTYLVCTANEYVDVFYFELTSKTHKDIFNRVVIAWCKLTDINPYRPATEIKEETK